MAFPKPKLPGKAGGLLKDKKAQAAVAVGAVLGLVALVRSRGSAEASDAEQNSVAGVQQTAGAGAAGGGYLGGYDSTASDVYNNLQTSLDNRLNGFGDQITDLQDQLKGLQNKPTPPKSTTPPKPKPKPGGGTAIPKKPGKPIPKPKPKPKPKTQNIFIPRGATLSGLANKYGTTVPALMRLNPQIKDKNKIYVGARLRVK